MTSPAPLVMGVLNVTPDSFSDGGLAFGIEAALVHARRLVAAGADIVDIGGESTRPGATPVALAEELDRVLPVVEACARQLPVRISVDTRKWEVAEAAVRAGATLVNDISGGADARLPGLGADGRVEFLLMHMQGTPETMQRAPSYPRGVVTEVRDALAARVAAFREAGVAPSRIWIDPGIGFGKTVEQNLELLRRLDELGGIGGRVAVGTSRKSFLGTVVGGAPLVDREPGTLATGLWAYQRGASVFRVHDVAAFRRALVTWRAVEGGRYAGQP